MDSKVGVDIISSKCCIPWRVMCITKKISTFLSILEEFKLHHIQREVNQPSNILATLSNSADDEDILYPNDFPMNLKDAILRDVFSCIYTRL